MHDERRRAAPDAAGTVRDGGGTVRDGGATTSDAAGTVRDGGATTSDTTGTVRDVGATVRDGAGPTRPFTLLNLPPTLAGDYEIVRELGSGREAELVLARHRDDDRLVAVKLYRVLPSPEYPRMMEHIIRAGQRARDHLVQVYASGEFQGRWWEVLEYLPNGSLADLIAREGPAIPDRLARDVLTELVAALEMLHRLGIVHRDLKPQNVLIRTHRPLDLVLSDFGLVTMLAATVEQRSGSRTPAYAAPEAAIGHVSPARDWWSLGMILVEALSGQHPYRLPDGGWMEDFHIATNLATLDVDVTCIPDERWQLLCCGLLTRDPADRWRAPQVRAWLQGESPPVARGARPGPAHRGPVVAFADGEYSSPDELAVAMADSWTEAVRLLAGRRASSPMVAHLRDFVDAHNLDDARRILAGHGEPDRDLARLLIALNPAIPPSFRGHDLGRDDLQALARGALAAGGEGAEASDLWALFRHGVLSIYAAVPGGEGHARLDERWHHGFERYQALVSRLRDGGEGTARPGAEVAELLDSGRSASLVLAHIVLCLLDPDHRTRLRSDAAACRRDRTARRRTWFAQMTHWEIPENEGVPYDALCVALSPIAVDEAHEEDAHERARQAERRREAKQQAQARRAAARAVRSRQDRTVWGWAAACLITAAGPWYAGHLLWRSRWAVAHTLPDPRVLSGWEKFVPDYLFGAGLVIGLVGLCMLRPTRGLTPEAVISGIMLLLVPVGGYYAAGAADEGLYRAALSTYANGARPSDTIPGKCDTIRWTWKDTPITWTLVRVGASGSPPCSVVAYRGWRRAWVRRPATHSSFNEMQGYGRLLLVTQGSDPGLGYTKLRSVVALDRKTGKTKWAFVCNCTAEVQYHGVDRSGERVSPVHGRTRYVRIIRSGASKAVVLDAMTGKRIS